MHPLKSKLLNKEDGGFLSSPMEHLSKNPCGKWKSERDNERAALRDKKVYLQNEEEKPKKKKKNKCGWWGRRAAKKRPLVVEKSQPMAGPKKKKTTKHKYERKNKGVCGRANPFPTLDLTAKVRPIDKFECFH